MKYQLPELEVFSVRIAQPEWLVILKLGEPVQVPATRVPKFRAAKALKEAVKQS